MRSGFSGLLALVAVLLCPVPTLAQSSEEDYSYARNLYKSQRYEQAATAFREFLDKNPNHSSTATATLYYGLTLSNLNRYKESREQFQSLIDRFPENKNIPDARYRLGECTYYMKDYKTAEKQLRDFRVQHSDHALVNWAYLFEAESQLATKQWVVGQQTFQQLLDRKPEKQTELDAIYGIGRCLEGQNKITGAFDYYRDLFKANDKLISPRALSRMGGLYFRAGDFEEAARAYKVIDERYAGNTLAVPARLNAGLAYYRNKKFDDAIGWLVRAKKDKANRPRADMLHALCLQKTDKYPEADQVLKELSEEFKDSPLLAEILYYRADGLRLSGRPMDAVPIFERIANEWPASQFADDALFFAADAAVLGKQYDKARVLLTRLEREHAEHPYADRRHLLLGRVFSNGNTDQELQKAVTEFVAAESSTKSERTKLLAKYYLARTHQRLREHPKAIDAAKPVVDEVIDGNASDLNGVLVLTAVSQLALDKFADAVNTATRYISMFPESDRIIDAYEARAIGYAKQDKSEDAEEDLKSLDGLSTDSERTGKAVRRVAEVAWERRDYKWSLDLFSRLTIDTESKLRPNGLSGVAWSNFELREWEAAAKAFGDLVDTYPTHELAPEAGFMQGESLRRGEKNSDAQLAYRKTFEKYLPREAAPVGAEVRVPIRFAFDSGRKLALLLSQMNTAEGVSEADKVYERLVTTFPRAGKLDELLDGWAAMYLAAGDNKQADRLYQRIIDERQDSPLVPNARLVLAESDMMASRYEKATAVFVALKTDGSFPPDVREDALYNLVTISEQQGKNVDVRKYADEYMEEFRAGRYVNHVNLLQAETLIRENKNNEAQAILLAIRAAVTGPDTIAEKWNGRVWVMLGETYLREKQYNRVRDTASEMLAKSDLADYYYQMYDVLGRSYLQEAPPDFDKARAAFQKVINDNRGSRTPTAGKCQILIGETWLNQEQHARALKEYQKAYFNKAYPVDVRAAGLYQAAGCEQVLQRSSDAKKSFEDLIRDFPNTRYAAEARKRIQQLRAGSGAGL